MKMQNTHKSKGISLIMLVITIIVIIILAGAVILSLSQNNPIGQANKATFLSDLKNFETELGLYITKQYANNTGNYDPTKLNADEVDLTYDGSKIGTENITNVITTLGNTSKYKGDFEVVEGKLIYKGSNKDHQQWAQDGGIIVENGAPKVILLVPQPPVVKAGTNVVYTVKFSGNAGIKEINLNGKIELLNKDGNLVGNESIFIIGTPTGTVTDKTRTVDITINTTDLNEGEYKLKIKAGVVKDENNRENTLDTTAQSSFDVDNTAPQNPEISASPATPTNQNVTVTITYSQDSSTKEYSVNNVTDWKTYTEPLIVSDNCTIYARGKDSAGNESGVSSIDIVNIDKIPPSNPTISINPTGWTNTNITATITYSGDSNKKEYSLDGTTWNNYTIPLKITDNLTIYAKATDEAENVSNIVDFVINKIDKTAPIISFGTNGGQTVTQVSTTVTVTDNESGVAARQYVWDTQNTTEPTSGWVTFTNGQTLTKTGDGTYYLWIKAIDNATNTKIEKSNSFQIGEILEIVSTVRTENTTFDGATTGFNYDNPVIPAGFVAVNTDDSKWNNPGIEWNNGLVIQDQSGNEFVWVPVDGTNVPYAKWCTTNITYNNANILDDTLPTGFNESTMISKYKGFYIARYEASFDYNGGNIRARSKKSLNKTTSNWLTTRNATYDGYLWNFINYTDAKTYSENMANKYGYDEAKVSTNLITGTQWDTAMRWINNSGKSVTNSITWGNYFNSESPANVFGYGSLQISGYTSYWKAKNVYDLAGNTYEFTNEKYSSNVIVRGGIYEHNGVNVPASYRYSRNVTSEYYYVSFRITIYIK